MHRYNIAGVQIDIDSTRLEPLERISEFRQDYQECAGLDIHFEFSKNIPVPDGMIISDDKNCIKWLKKPAGSNGYFIYFYEYNTGDILVLADIDEEWSQVQITCRDFTGVRPQESFSQQTWACAHFVIGVIFRYRIIQFNGMIIHSSALKYHDQSIMFVAPSGTGKSTHVKLWHEYFKDVTTLNDDTPAVRIIDNQPYVYGTPWSGSSMIHSTDSAPLKAIVIIEQAKENKIRQLGEQDAIMRLMARTFLPYFDKELMNKTISLFEKIILTSPVYLLQCRPDQEAVETVYQCLYT